MLKKYFRTNVIAVVIASLCLVYISPSANAEPSSILGTTGTNPLGIIIDSSGNIYTTNRTSNNVTKITVFDQAAATAEAARVAAAQAAANAEAARKAKEQQELTEILALIPSIGELTLSLGETTKSLYSTKCVKGKTTKYVKSGAKCPKGYVRKK
jgi:hypothetical protein